MGEENNKTDQEHCSEKFFEEALKARDTALIKKLASRGFYVNQILKALPPLSFALDKGLFELVDVLVSLGADTCQLDSSGKFCPMFYAIKNKCPTHVVKRLISSGAGVNEIVEYNFSSNALHLAVFENRKSVIKFLLSLFANVNARTQNCMTPLHVAVQENHPKVVKLLVSKGAELDAEDSHMFTPLMLAIHDNNFELVSSLISLGSDVNFEPKEPKYSYQKPLNYAVGLGHVEIVRLLLEHEADARPTAVYNDSPLHSLAYSDESLLNDKTTVRDIINLLVEHGGNLNCYNNVGQNPLHSAIISRNSQVAKTLMKVGASVADKTLETKDTPLHLAAIVGDSRTVSLLLNSGADRASRNSFGLTPYDLALKQKDTETVRTFWCHGQPYDDYSLEWKEVNECIQQLIIEQGKFINAVDSGLHTEMVDALKNGAEPKGCSLSLKLPLHSAVYQNHESIVLELLARGAPVSVIDQKGESVLHLACKNGNKRLVVHLLAHGACYNLRSHCGQTPLQVALANKHKPLARFIKCVDGMFLYTHGFLELSFTRIITLINCDPQLPGLFIRFTFNCVNRKGNTIIGDALACGDLERAQKLLTYQLKYSLQYLTNST